MNESGRAQRKMQEPEYVVSFYVATCGQNGNNLGSDEKEIILMVYFILNGFTGELLGTKQILVRPDGNLGNKIYNISSAVEASAASISNNVKGFDCNNLNNSAIINNKNKSHVESSSLMNNASGTNMINLVMSSSSNPPSSATKEFFSDLSITDIQELGKPLSEAIEEFNLYLRSQSICEANVSLVTDGQLPLRQCLHREACAKDIVLPAMYNKFCDLRKEYQKFKTGDLSKALVPMKDISKMLQIPVRQLPQSIEEIVTDLNLLTSDIDGFYSKDSREMAAVVQNMIQSGHRFIPNEEINLILEPGICSIDDEIDGNCIVRARGLPWQSSDEDIAKFFRGLNVAKGGVALCLSPLGRRNGEALIRFVSQEHRDMALKRHKHHIGPRYIEVYRATGEDFLSVAGGASNEAQSFLSKGAQVIIRMRGLPYDCTAKQVLEFFTTGENPCEVLDGTEGVLFVKKPDGRATGDAFVLFANERDAPKALGRHRESIGQRYIELFRSTTAEVQQVLNRSMDPKLYEQNQTSTPLIAQLPTVPMSLLPQHLITSGTMKNCIRLRGLPYEALVEHILHFLDDFAKHIIYQGVHMVINAQGQPSGEAFIQMDSEESARLCAQRKHNQFMIFGKKYRYIEVFQCSGDDMNMVLNGGLQTPLPVPSHPSTTAGKHTPLISSGMLVQPQQANAQTLSPHTHSHVSHASHTLQSQSSLSAIAALAQQPHLPLSSNAPTVGLTAGTVNAAGLPHFVSPSNIPPTPSTQHSANLVATPNPLTVPSSLHVNTANQLTIPSISVGNSSLTGMSFNLHLPQTQLSASNSSSTSLFTQQAQAQFIAQQNLLVRQQAAAVAAEQQQLYTNILNPLFLPSSSTGALSSPILSATHPQFMFMPRPYFHPMQVGYTMAPQNFSLGSIPSASLQSASNAAAAVIQQNMKRSYENAFQQDQGTAATVPKRTFTRNPGNSYYQYYNPGV